MAGVFVIVGLAAVAIAVSVLFWFRQKRNTRVLDHDTTVAAALAEHGYARQSLIDGDDHHTVSDPRAATTTPSGSGSSANMRALGHADSWWPGGANTTFGGLGTAPVSGGDVHGLADSLGQSFNPQPDYHAPQQNPFQAPQQDGYHHAAQQDPFQAGQQGTSQAPQQGTPQAPQHGTSQAPQQGNYQAPQQGTYQAPQQGTYQAPQQGTYQAPQQGTYQAPQQGTFQAPQQGGDPGPSNPGGSSGFGLLSGWPFFAQGQKDTMGSTEPLLGGNFGSDSPPEYSTPILPAMDPMMPVGGARRRRSDGRSGEGDSNDDASFYEDDDFEYEALAKRSLKVRSGVVDLTSASDYLSLIIGSKRARLLVSGSNDMDVTMLDLLLDDTLYPRLFSLTYWAFQGHAYPG